MNNKYYTLIIAIAAIMFFNFTRNNTTAESGNKIQKGYQPTPEGNANDHDFQSKNRANFSHSDDRSSTTNQNGKSDYGKTIDLIQNGKLPIAEFLNLCEDYENNNLNNYHLKDFVDYWFMSDQYSVEDKLQLLHMLGKNALFADEIRLYASFLVDGLAKQGVDWNAIHATCNLIKNTDAKLGAYDKLYKLQYGKIDQLKFLAADEVRIAQLRQFITERNPALNGDTGSSRFFADIFDYAWKNGTQNSESYSEIMNNIESLNVEDRFKSLIIWKFSGKDRFHFEAWKSKTGKYLDLNENSLKKMYAK